MPSSRSAAAPSRARQRHGPRSAATSGDGSAMRRRRSLAAGMLLVAATIIVYVPAIGAGFIWDDDAYVTKNEHLGTAQGLGRIWIPRQTPQYYPLVFTTFWIEHQLWGLHPTGYHLVNVLLHAAAAVLLWRIGARLRFPGAWLIAAVFALHPVHVESVAWIAERKNVLSGVLYLLAASAYLRFDEAPRDAGTVERAAARRWYGLSLLCFIGALLSKSVTASLPVALGLVMIHRGRSLTVARLRPLVPMLVLGLVLGLHTAWLEQSHVGASGPDFDLSLIERASIASRALLFYPWKLLVPAGLAFNYPRWSTDIGSLAAWWAAPIVMLVAIAAALAWRSGRRAPALALGFYAVTIFPALGFFNVYPMVFSFVADHYQYLASIGLIVLVTGSASTALRGRAFALPLAGGVLVALGSLTWIQGTMYQDYEQGRLWAWTLRVNPESWLAQSGLGLALAKQGRLEEAEAHLLAAAQAKPLVPIVHANLGHLRFAQRRTEEAIACYRRAAALDERYASHMALALILLGRDDEAEDWARQALDADPGQRDLRRWLVRRVR